MALNSQNSLSMFHQIQIEISHSLAATRHTKVIKKSKICLLASQYGVQSVSKAIPERSCLMQLDHIADEICVTESRQLKSQSVKQKLCVSVRDEICGFMFNIWFIWVLWLLYLRYVSYFFLSIHTWLNTLHIILYCITKQNANPVL